MDVAIPDAIRRLDSDGCPRSVVGRVESMLTAVGRNGGWDGEDGEAWRVALGDLMVRALLEVPAVLLDAHPGLPRAVVGPGVLVAVDHRGVVARVALEKRAIPFQAHPCASLTGEPRSLYHWDRHMRPVPARDPLAAAALAPQLTSAAEVAGRLVSDSVMATPPGLGRPDWPSAAGGRMPAAAFGAVGREPEFHSKRRPIPNAAWATARILNRLGQATVWAFHQEVAKLLNPEAARAARRLGLPRAYGWLAAPLSGAEVGERRRQFAVAYPELVKAVALTVAPGCQELNVAIDTAAPATPLVRRMRNWPRWVDRALRGRMTATTASGFYTAPSPNYGDNGSIDVELVEVVAQTLVALGPAWRPRHGDQTAMAALSMLARELGLPALSAIGAACSNPGAGASPWKRVWARVPAASRFPWNDGFQLEPKQWTQTTASGIADMVRAFTFDVVAPISGNRALLDYTMERNRFAAILRLSPLRRLPIHALLELSAEWHARLPAIRRAQAPIPHHGIEADGWEALFSPFCVIDGRIEVACITGRRTLSWHGDEMGHCVGSYAWDCTVGRTHIAALSVDDVGVATACFRIDEDGVIRLTEARGQHNGPLPPAANSALAALELVLANKRSNFSALDCADAARLEGARLHRAATADRAGFRRGHDEPPADDPETLDRVVRAWRFALPDRTRAAWERADGCDARLEAVREWLRVEAGVR